MAMRFENFKQYENFLWDPDYTPNAENEFEIFEGAVELLTRKIGKGLLERVLNLSDQAAQELEKRLLEIMNKMEYSF